MTRKTILSLIIALVAVLLLGIGMGRCTAPEPTIAHAVDSHAAAEGESATVWTCSMHPQVRQPNPGDCPICGMDLIPARAGEPTDESPRVLSMSESAKALAEIQTSLVERRYAEVLVRLVGRLEPDETREKSLTARFPARIDELFVNYVGVPVERGQHLARVYSPELLTAQRELLTAYKSDPESSITRAAREKLRLLDLLPEQIEAIIERGEARDHFVLRAPIGGIVLAKNVNQGDYIQTGEELFRIVDLSELWLFLDAYESDFPWLRYGQAVTFTVEAYPGETFEGRIDFIEPTLDPETRTIRIRVNVPNPDGRLKPGMFASGIVRSRIAEDGHVYAPELAGKWISPMHPEIVKDHPGKCDICGMDLVPAEDLGYVNNTSAAPPLVVPASAVLRTGKRAVVYVEVPGRERPTYQGREIVLGPRAGDVFLVEEGLEAGESVVTNGAFKIDSALQIQAKPSMMSMSVARERESGRAGDGEALRLSSELAGEVIDDYLKLQNALAGDDLVAAKDALKEMMRETGHTGALPDLIHQMLAAEDLEALRKPHFVTLSNALIAVIEEVPALFEDELVRVHCPMANNNNGADWIQSGENVRNPYFGAAMLRCGEIVGAIPVE